MSWAKKVHCQYCSDPWSTTYSEVTSKLSRFTLIILVDIFNKWTFRSACTTQVCTGTIRHWSSHKIIQKLLLLAYIMELLNNSAHNACEVGCLLCYIAWLFHWHDCSETPAESPVLLPRASTKSQSSCPLMEPAGSTPPARGPALLPTGTSPSAPGLFQTP